jgi:ferredoxin-NAD(P)+ reductase (naphthalene dioxygenase ferredoxin-specific)
MSMELLIRPLDRVLTVPPGANLLEVLREHEIPVSYSCTAGRCGICRCKLIDGEALEGGRDSSRNCVAEQRYVLACQTFLTESCAIEIPEPDEVVVHPQRIVKATVVGLEDMTHDIKRLRLRPAKPIEFSPGQYVHLQFTPEHTRPYSMAGLCQDEELEFQVRLVPEGRVTSYIANTLKVGDAVRVSGPLGTAYLRRKHTGPMICVAGGTGLSPVLSIVRGAIAASMTNPVHLYFGVRSPRDIYGLSWLEALQRDHADLHLHVVVTSNADSAKWRSGLVTDVIAEDWADLSGWRAYLCGSPPMVEAATLLVKRKGVAQEQIHADAFYPTGI